MATQSFTRSLRPVSDFSRQNETICAEANALVKTVVEFPLIPPAEKADEMRRQLQQDYEAQYRKLEQAVIAANPALAENATDAVRREIEMACQRSDHVRLRYMYPERKMAAFDDMYQESLNPEVKERRPRRVKTDGHGGAANSL